MKRVLPNVTPAATSAITATSDDQLAYLCNVKRLSQRFYTGPRYILAHNTTPAKWATIDHALGDGFITKYADPLCLLGTGFGANTSYDMFDIDRDSRNHPSNDPRAFERFLATLDKIGLTTPVIVQSSSSGGIHVYYFFDRDINTFRLASLSQVSLIDAKFEIKDGTLELFPNCKDYGNKSNHKPHRSPLQPNGGGLLLDRQGNPLTCGANLNHETQLAAFLEMAKASARGNDVDKILRKIAPVYEKFKSNPSKYQHTHKKHESEGVREWREDLEVLMITAWTGFHQTNELIQRFIEYGVVFLKLNNEKDLFEWAFEAITSANGYKQYCRHQPQIEARIRDWIEPTLAKEFYVPYCAHPTRSIDRDKFIAQYKHSKASPTTKAEVYKRVRVESVASKIQETVETILATIADLPSRIGDWIGLIQSTARQKYGHGFSNTTLQKPHYKYIWVNLIATKKPIDMVLVTPITPTNIVYQTETSTETAFESSVLDVTGLPKTNIKPIGGETSHRAPSVCSVNALSRSLIADVADPAPDSPKLNIPLDLDLDSDLGLELKHIFFNSIDSQSALTLVLYDFDTHPQFNEIEPSELNSISRDSLIESDPIYSSTADLTRIPVHDRDKSIESDPTDRDKFIQPDPSHRSIPIEPDPIEPLPSDSISRPDLFPEQTQSLTTANLGDLDANPRSIPIELTKADLISRSDADRDRSIAPDPKPSVKYFMSLTLEEKMKLTDQELREMRLSDLPLVKGCLVRLQDTSHAHGNDRGIVTEIHDWDVCVSWSDHTSGHYTTDQLICTYSPNLKN
jgi:hypothetical protein